jgi:large subunit ribosomal protein L4
VPRKYDQRTPKKMIAAALLGAISDRARAGRLHVIQAIAIDTPSTKTAKALLEGLSVGKNVLVVLDSADEAGWLSVRNLPNVHVLAADQLNAYDVLVSDDIVFTQAAYDAFVAAKTKKANPELAAKDKEGVTK